MHCSMVNHHLGVSKNIGTPKWMVIMESPIKIDDLGYHYFWKHPFVKKKCLELLKPKHPRVANPIFEMSFDPSF